MTRDYAALIADSQVIKAEEWYSCGGDRIPDIRASGDDLLDRIDVINYRVLDTCGTGITDFWQSADLQNEVNVA